MGLSEVTGLPGKSGYLCPSGGRFTFPESSLTWEELEPGVGVAGRGIC